MTNREVFFLPGTMCDERLWHPLWAKLDARIKTCPIPLEKKADIPSMLHLMERSLGSTPSHIVAFSMGAYVALNFALSFPSQIQSMVLIGGSAMGLKEEEMRLRRNTLNYLKSNPYRGISSLRIKKFVAPENHGQKEIFETIRTMDRDLGQQTLENQLLSTLERPSLVEDLGKLRCPVLLVRGAQDQFVESTALKRMNEALSNVRMETLDQCGHMVPLEKPKALAQLLEEFFLD